MRRASLLVPLVVFMVIVSGCLGGGNTPTSTPSSASSPALETTSTTSVEQVPPVKFLYPEEPKVVNLSYGEVQGFFVEKYAKVPYSQHGNITVNYTNGVFRGRYEFVLTNFTSRTLYLALLVTPNGPLTLNITIEGVPLELSRMNVYRWIDDEGFGVGFYAVNVSTNFTTLKGVVTYDFRYLENKDYIRQMWERDVLIGTDFSWWEFASKNATITVTPICPKTLFSCSLTTESSAMVQRWSTLHHYTPTSVSRFISRTSAGRSCRLMAST
ncbi:hypothetical protein [Thermococcus sp. LS1]|uniref:hypothetical protein n=1 Tax=Thermococcus sp. LS1 TaxID=1638259 RepID=UPI001F0E33B2|nr:hypothetical protein [Thermococcus sp. LS1]